MASRASIGIPELFAVSGLNCDLIASSSAHTYLVGSAVGNAMRNGKTLLMNKGYSEDEALTIMTTGADFGITQVVDGNWGAHVVIPKYVIGEKAGNVYTSLVECGTSSKSSSAARTGSTLSLIATVLMLGFAATGTH